MTNLFSTIRRAISRELFEDVVGVVLMFAGLIAAFYIAHGAGL